LLRWESASVVVVLLLALASAFLTMNPARTGDAQVALALGFGLAVGSALYTVRDRNRVHLTFKDGHPWHDPFLVNPDSSRAKGEIYRVGVLNPTSRPIRDVTVWVDYFTDYERQEVDISIGPLRWSGDLDNGHNSLQGITIPAHRTLWWSVVWKRDENLDGYLARATYPRQMGHGDYRLQLRVSSAPGATATGVFLAHVDKDGVSLRRADK